MPHYADHLVPIWHALPLEYRGGFFAKSRAAQRATELGVTGIIPRKPAKSELVLVAGHEDYKACKQSAIILLNHGCGMRYWGDPTNTTAYRHPSYSGGKDRGRVVMFLGPSQADADINKEFYPEAESVAIGVPKLDPWHLLPPRHLPRDKPTVALSFHADISVCPETRWTFPQFQQAMKEVVRAGDYNFIGHGHPRAQLHLKHVWESLGIPFVSKLSDVFDQADVFVCDNSSAAYETASIGIPNVVLNGSHYRRDVHHNLRFWSSIPGIEVAASDQLPSAIEEALKDPPYLRAKREDAVNVAYAGVNGLLADGRATGRAVQALIELAESL